MKPAVAKKVSCSNLCRMSRMKGGLFHFIPYFMTTVCIRLFWENVFDISDIFCVLSFYLHIYRGYSSEQNVIHGDLYVVNFAF